MRATRAGVGGTDLGDPADGQRVGTRERLLKAATKALAANPAGEVRLTDVLHEADASPSSLYHFFGNLGGLVREAKMARFGEASLIAAYDSFKAATLAATTREEFADALDVYLEHLAGPSRTAARRARASAVLAVYDDERLRERLWETQSHLYEALIEVLRVPVSKGLISDDIDMLGVVTFADGLFFGRLLSETSGPDAVREHWYRRARESLYVALFDADGLALARRG